MATGKQAKDAAKRAAKKAAEKIDEEINFDDVVGALGKQSDEIAEDLGAATKKVKSKTEELFEKAPDKPKEKTKLDPATSAVNAKPGELEDAVSKWPKVAAGGAAMGGAAFAATQLDQGPVKDKPLEEAVNALPSVPTRGTKPPDAPTQVEPPRAPPGVSAPPKFVPGQTNPDEYFNAFFDRTKDVMFASDSMAPEQKDEFAQELAEIRKTFQSAKSDLEKREIAHTIADAVTQFAGGWWGMKTGADINLKMKDHDFAKDLALVQEQLKIDLGDLRGRREEDLKKRERAADMAMKQADLKFKVVKEASDRGLAQQKIEADMFGNSIQIWKAQNDDAYSQWMAGETARHNTSMEEYQRATLEARGLADKNEGREKAQAAFVKLKGETSEDIARIMNTAEFRKDPEKGTAALIPLASRVGIPPEKVRDALFKKGVLWGQNPKDEIEATVELQNLIRSAGAAPQMLKMSHPKHGTMDAPNEEAAARMEKAGWARN